MSSKPSSHFKRAALQNGGPAQITALFCVQIKQRSWPSMKYGPAGLRCLVSFADTPHYPDWAAQKSKMAYFPFLFRA